MKRIFLIVILGVSSIAGSWAGNSLFLSIPVDEQIYDYVQMTFYLKGWDDNEVEMNEEQLSAFFTYFFGSDSLHGLQFESFLRFTKNERIQGMILQFIDKNSIKTNFTDSLRILYEAVPKVTQSGGNEHIRYRNSSVFDENINLFSFDEVTFFNNELGLLLYDNDWNIMMFDGGNENSYNADETFFLTYGGGSNSLSIRLTKHSNVSSDNLDDLFNLNFYNERFYGEWDLVELPLEGVLRRAGADRYFIASGIRNDIGGIENAVFNAYLYNRARNTLYEVGYSINFSPANIFYNERERIYNLLLFQTLLVFLR